MRNMFLCILLMFLSPEGYRLQFSIPRAYLCIRYDTVLANSAVLSMRVRIVCLPARSAPGECYYNALLCCKDYFSSLSVVSRAFSALYSKCGDHPHLLGYRYVKFRFFRGLRC